MEIKNKKAMFGIISTIIIILVILAIGFLLYIKYFKGGVSVTTGNFIFNVSYSKQDALSSQEITKKDMPILRIIQGRASTSPNEA